MLRLFIFLMKLFLKDGKKKKVCSTPTERSRKLIDSKIEILGYIGN